MLNGDEMIHGPSGQQISIIRVFEAPIHLVFSMWTNPAYLSRWWGPKNNSNHACEMDVRPGGSIHISMQLADGQLVQVNGIFNEVSPPHKLVFTTLKDEKGNTGLEVLHSLTLTEARGQTTLRMDVAIIKTTPGLLGSCQGMELGWNQSFDRLAEQVLQLLKIK